MKVAKARSVIRDRSSDLQGADQLRNCLNAMLHAPALQPIDNLFCSTGIPEISGTNLDSGSSGPA